MSDPFTEPSSREEGGSPFAASLFQSAVKESATHVMGEAGDLLGAAMSVHAQSRFAKKTGNVQWMMRLKGYATDLSHVASDFIRQAIFIALAKFVLELCAMVINSVMELISRKGKQRLEISTPNIHYVPAGAPMPHQQNGAQVQRSNEYVNPFSTSFSNNNQMVSPW